jgi:hypothetical protein
MHCRWVIAGMATTFLNLSGSASSAQDEATEKNPPAASDQPPQPAGKVKPENIHAMLGKEVRSSSGERMGMIVNILVDNEGAPSAAVIDFGGFLGVGSRKIAVDWKALRFTPYENYERITSNLTRDEVKAAPEFKEGQPVFIVGVSEAAGP